MDLLRKPIADWTRSPLVWTTQFNDLRNPMSLGSEAGARYRRIQLELKMLALLLPRAVIRDSDVVNHIELLDLVQRNVDGVRSVFESGIVTLGIRESASSLVDVNERAGQNRAYPERYGAARSQLPGVDSWLRERRVVLVETPADVKSDGFAANLQKIVDGRVLSAGDEEILRKAMAVSRELRGDEALLRFGDVYQYVLGKGLGSSHGDVVQWCRAAHVLIAPAAHALPPSTVDQDLRPEMVTFLCGGPEGVALDPEKWTNLYPRRILHDEALMRMDFATVERLRVQARRIGYFDAALRIQRGARSEDFERSYEAYLRTLGEYLEIMGKELSVELVPWQKVLLDRRVKVEEEEAKGLWWSVPILIGVTLSIVTWSVVPVGLLGVAVPGLERIRSLRAARAPSPLSRLLSGTTVTPNTAR